MANEPADLPDIYEAIRGLARGRPTDADRGLNTSPKPRQELPAQSGLNRTPEFFPEFTNSNEPPPANRRYTPEFRHRASVATPGPSILDYHGLDMGGHIQNLRDLLAQNGIATDLTAPGPEVLAHATYERLVNVLTNLYYRGERANNFVDHRGGLEFRNWATPGFHFKVVYPPLRGPDTGETRISDLHLDRNNPLFDDQLGAHMNDFRKEKR